MIVEFHNKEVCEIDLAPSKSLERWIEIHLRNKSNCGFWTRKSAIVNHHKQQVDKTIFKNSPIAINKAIEDIKNLTGIDWPIRAYSGMGFKECNEIHRFFTTSANSYKNFAISQKQKEELFREKINKQPTEFCYRQKFLSMLKDVYKVDEEKDFLDSLLHKINSEVHRYEDMCLSSERSTHIGDLCGWASNTRILDIDWDNKGHNGESLRDIRRWTTNETDSEEKSLEKTVKDGEYHKDILDCLSVNTEFNVYQIKDIKGKDYALSYQQYDNPTNWDITSTMTVNGGFTLDIDSAYPKFYNSELFKNWLKEYGHPYNPRIFGLIPIGTIVSCPSIDEVHNVCKPLKDCETPFHSETHMATEGWKVVDTKFYR